jgi:DNA-directed RNA polymerase specialized sigma24 family protein
MKPIRIPTLNSEQLDALEKLYRTTREARLRTRAQMVLLAAERRLSTAEIAEIVRTSEETVRRLISSVTWPRELRACATCRIRARRAR